MRVFLMLALSASALLATTSTQAHTHPAAVTLAVARNFHVAPDSIAALASPTTGPTVHVSTSHPSYGGFHSTPSYRSFSATPSRSYNFSRANSPSSSTRLAMSSRSYSTRR